MKDWAKAIAPKGGVHSAKEVGKWLWDRFIGDGRKNYGKLEQAHVEVLLATGYDLGYLADANNSQLIVNTGDPDASQYVYDR